MISPIFHLPLHNEHYLGWTLHREQQLRVQTTLHRLGTPGRLHPEAMVGVSQGHQHPVETPYEDLLGHLILPLLARCSTKLSTGMQEAAVVSAAHQRQSLASL